MSRSSAAAASSPLSPPERLRIISQALPGVATHECLIEASFSRCWSFIADLETSVPQFDKSVRSVRVTARSDSRLSIVARSRVLFVTVPLKFDVELLPGWCLMRSSWFMVGIAAAPVENGTRYLQSEGVTISAPPLLRPVLRIAAAVRSRHVRRDAETLRRLLAEQPPDESFPPADSS